METQARHGGCWACGSKDDATLVSFTASQLDKAKIEAATGKKLDYLVGVSLDAACARLYGRD